MSRRPIDAANANSRANSGTLRRQAANSEAASTHANDIPTRMDLSIDACKAWLVQDEENEAVIKKWQSLEDFLIHQRGWFELSERQRASVPEAKEFYAVQERLDALQSTRRDLLKTISQLDATSLYGLSLKLSVASRVIPPDENEEGHALVIGCLQNLRDMTL